MTKRITAYITLTLIMAAQLQGQVLNVKQVTQQQNQWCWAAVSVCVLNYYSKIAAQCEVAEYTRTHEQFSDLSYGNNNCCTSPSTCNNWNYFWGSPGTIEDILLHFASLPCIKIDGTIPLATITNTIGANRLFLMRWALTAGGGHFVVGHGISNDNIYYMNPWYGEGKKVALYSWMLNASDHTWTSTMTLNVSAQPPADAGLISGPAAVCQGGESVTYSVPAIARALAYEWTLPEGVAGGSDSSSIAVDFTSTAVSGNIEVKGVNNLGYGVPSTFAVTVNPLPSAPGPVEGPNSVCQRERKILFSVPDIPNAEEYIWTLPDGATGASNKKNILVDFGFTPGTGFISVKGHNDCGDGPESSLAVTVNAYPDRPTITLQGNVLTSSSPVGNQWHDESGPIEGAVDQTYTVTEDGYYYVVVTINGCSSDPSDEIFVTPSGIDLPAIRDDIRIFPNPATDRLSIETKVLTEDATVKILNSFGQTVFMSTLDKNSLINTHLFPQGVYLIRIESRQAVYLRKFIKQ